MSASASTPVRATLLMTGAMACFACMGIFVRLAAEDVHALEAVFFRNFLMLLLMLPWVAHQGLGVLRTRKLGLYWVRAVLNVLGMAAGFVALTLIPLAEATALSFTAPLFATIGAVLVLGERIRARRILALLIGFSGTLIVLRPGVEAVSPGALLALANALLLSMTVLVVKRLTGTERPETIVTYMALLQTPLALVPALFVWTWPDPLTWLWLTLLAGAGTLGHVLFTRAYAVAEVTQMQPMEFVRLPIVALVAYLLFDEVPSAWIWLGGIVIFASTAYITHREVLQARRSRAGASR